MRSEEFVQGPVVAQRKREEPVFHVAHGATAFEKPRHVEEVPRMLPVQRRAELAAIQFFTGQDGHFR